VTDPVTWVRAQWDRTGGFALLAGGAVLLLSGWVGVSGTSDRAGQLSYLVSGGLGGLFCLAAGATLLLFADLDDECRKLDELSGLLDQHGDPSDGVRRGGGAVVLVAGLAAALLLAIGWFWASGADDQRGAIPGLLVAIAALLAADLVEGSSIWRASRSLTSRKVTLLDAVSARCLVADLRSGPIGPAPTPAPAPADGTVLTVDGLRRYHRPGCPTMAGVDATAVPRDRVSPDLLPCRLCEAP